MPGNPLSDELLGEILAGCNGPAPRDGYVLIKRGLYWRPNYAGYTGVLAQAGVYSDGDSAARLDEGVKRMRFSEAAEIADATFIDIERDYWREETLKLRELLAPAVTELIERRKAGTFAEGIEAAAKVADIHADGYAEAIRGLTRNKFATEYRGKHDAARKIGRAIRSLTPNKDTTS